ncbi:MAG TPA: DsbE family thiol:disulfide interchange protein [Rhizomicrobium sp.]|jgi:cytochrome c biogenesis protein CcmG/thiol:disulfide interchange protein DsbE|nr:DsbE family thiol:disulfide interchange protein [Rhizomicrobium sp.]
MKRLVYAVPVLGFLMLAFFLFKSLIMPAPDVLPSALIDKPAPALALAAMDDATPGFSSADLESGHVTVVNFFASWCVPCRMEHAQLMGLSNMPGVALYGVDYEERQPGAGRAFLKELGNPFSRIVDDGNGAEGIQWGVYGVPETYVVDGKGIVRFKLVGPLTPEALSGQLLPAMQKAKLAS